ncbi:MAG: GTP-binding protein [Myxococcota bacterium]|jgi:GTP-binding protein
MSKPLVAIVGRPNVGKSTLFNRLVGRRSAIVEDQPGVTRDRQYGDAEFMGRTFMLIDTGGFEPETADPMLKLMREQAQLAIDEADTVILLFDGQVGLLAADREIAQMLKRSGKVVHYVVNKIDGTRHEALSAEFWELGVHELWNISAQHAGGVYDMMEAVLDGLPDMDDDDYEADEDLIKVAVVGKPNAGKSTLLNRMLGEERMLVSPTPGTTRDSIDAWVTIPAKDEDSEPRRYMMIDTAGVRRRKWIRTTVEKISIVRTFKSIDRADVCLLLIDATEGVTDQDAKIARMISDKGKACVILLNKWDLVDAKEEGVYGDFIKEVKNDLGFVSWAPIVTISAKSGQRSHKIMDLVDMAFANWIQRVPTGALNRTLESILQSHTPPVYKNRRLKFLYATQVTSRPPTIILWVNDAEAVQESYMRFLSNRFRQTFVLEGTPLKLAARTRKSNTKNDEKDEARKQAFLKKQD